MTDKQWFQLVAPPIGGLGFFVLALVLARATGDLNRYTWKALLASGGLISYVVYLTFWQDEIKNAWGEAPYLVILGLLSSTIVPIGLFYWIWRVQMGAKAERAALGSISETAAVRIASTSSKVFSLVVLLWGIANLLGLLVAIVHALLQRR
jgi:hypothetical protein